MSKSKNTSKSSGKPKVRFYESDDGKTWSEFDAGEPEVKDPNIARLEQPELNYYVPIDHRTPLGNELLGFARLPAIKDRFGDGCMLRAVKDYVERAGRRWETSNWSDVIFMIEREKNELPRDLIKLKVAPSRYRVTERTLRRRVENGEIKSYRLSQKKNAAVYVTKTELDREYELRT
jgi:hypothetical protein